MAINIEEMRADIKAGTPGKWAVEHDECGERIIEVSANDDCDFHPVAQCEANYTCRQREENEANARRIARLPELEAAFLDMVETYERWSARIAARNEATAKVRSQGKSVKDKIFEAIMAGDIS